MSTRVSSQPPPSPWAPWAPLRQPRPRRGGESRPWDLGISPPSDTTSRSWSIDSARPRVPAPGGVDMRPGGPAGPLAPLRLAGEGRGFGGPLCVRCRLDSRTERCPRTRTQYSPSPPPPAFHPPGAVQPPPPAPLSWMRPAGEPPPRPPGRLPDRPSRPRGACGRVPRPRRVRVCVAQAGLPGSPGPSGRTYRSSSMPPFLIPAPLCDRKKLFFCHIRLYYPRPRGEWPTNLPGPPPSTTGPGGQLAHPGREPAISHAGGYLFLSMGTSGTAAPTPLSLAPDAPGNVVYPPGAFPARPPAVLLVPSGGWREFLTVHLSSAGF